MAVTTVVTTNEGSKVALCSCGWEGEHRAVPGDAYHDKGTHQKWHAAHPDQQKPAAS